VVSNFRARYCRGRTGRATVPFVDYLFSGMPTARVALNIGGIANITVIPEDAR
jgi:1,6-anhydro-N-acetylmuramate kinase